MILARRFLATVILGWIGVASSIKAAEKLSAPKEISIRSTKDGTDQPALFEVPPGAEKSGQGEAVPLVVALHTWSSTYTSAPSVKEAAAECAQLGWVFVAPDFRGPNVRPEACASELAVQDVLDAVEHAKQHARVDADRIFLVGGSGGGHMALVMAHQSPTLWAGVSAWVPIVDLADWYASTKTAKLRYWEMMEKCCGGSPGTAQTDWEYQIRSPIFFLEKAKGLRIDLNAGIRDGHDGASVPIRHTLRAFNVLAIANGFKDKVLSDDEVSFMTEHAKVPAHLAKERVDEPGRQGAVLFRRSTGQVRVTVFDGGHDIDVPTAFRWFVSLQGGTR
jgi:pimeloyl-ACP methyl ester carboxylesterase